MELRLSERQKALLEFVKEQHGDQKRKYTGEPYWTHPVAVATLLQKYFEDEPCYKEIALCHDLFEDTECKDEDLNKKLSEIGYADSSIERITDGVWHLTDLYTKEEFPHLNREKRKKLEADRLSRIQGLFKSIKCADLIDNTSSIVKYDPNFATIYLEEKEQVLKSLQGAHIGIYIDACYSLRYAQLQLNLSNNRK